MKDGKAAMWHRSSSILSLFSLSIALDTVLAPPQRPRVVVASEGKSSRCSNSRVGMLWKDKLL